MEEVSLYCSIAQEVITWTIVLEYVDLLSGSARACHSMCCSKYIEDGCCDYGCSDECTALMKQARKEIR